MKESNDILSLFEALNSHEVFTPPRVARQMLDLLPSEIWSDPSIKILDPCTKSGVFLRECLFRLFDGLEGAGSYEASDGKTYDLDDRQQRINHIFKNMLFGIATSELTGYVARRTLYGVMKANVDKQTASLDAFEKSSNFRNWTEEEISNFIGRNKFNQFFDHNLFCDDEYAGFESEGNIFYPNGEVAKIVIEDDDYEIEDKYFPFIENTNHKKIAKIRDGKMKFDVIIGNPPYQVSSGNKTSDSPIYHKFVEQAIEMKPKYASFIIPSRWFAGGKGLDKFREEMLSNKKIAVLVDILNSNDCFKGVDIKGGVCYFLWDHSNKDDCKVISIRNGNKSLPMIRSLSKYDVFVRFNEAISIIEKVVSQTEKSFDKLVTSQTPFGILTSFDEYSENKFEDSVVFYGNKNKMGKSGLGYIDRKYISKNKDLIDPYKVFVSYAYGAGEGYPHQIIGEPFVGKRNSCCSQTYTVCGTYETKEEAENAVKYMKTKFFRFLVAMKKNTQHTPPSKFSFVPVLDMKAEWTDKDLYEAYGLSDDEIEFIESMIRPME